VSRQIVRRWIASGRITAYRVGSRMIRVDLDEIEAKIIHTVPTVKRLVMINEDVAELDNEPVPRRHRLVC
jgi:predicted site-specific integrase-resolvase